MSGRTWPRGREAVPARLLSGGGSDGLREFARFLARPLEPLRLVSPYVPHAKAPQAGSVDLCFISSQLLEDWQAHLANHDVSVEEGPVRKSGANGTLMSLYIRDPDGNLIEISNYI